jgi:hypothetical protein
MALSERLIAQAGSLLFDAAGAGKASVELPAGCGKTEIVVATAQVGASEGQHVLVLTHTNAGVAAIRRRLQRHGVHGEIAVTTIDSFMQRIQSAFPSLGAPVLKDENDDGYWPELRAAAVEIAASPNVAEILRGSYDLLIVDEYQDCSTDQHALVVGIASHVRTVVFGDRMQAIFGFGGVTLVDWEHDVQSEFPTADELFDVVPHRWSQTNRELGEWLLDVVRPALGAHEPLDLGSLGFLTRTASDDAAKRNVPYQYFDTRDSTVFILPDHWRLEGFAKNLRGQFPVIEDVGMRRVAELSRSLTASDDGGAVAAAVVEFLCGSHTTIATVIGGKATGLARIRSGKAFAPRKAGAESDFQLAINRLRAEPTAERIAELLEQAHGIDGASCFATERIRDFQTVLAIVGRGEVETYDEAVASVRKKRRYHQRRGARRGTAHPPLIKGLEFDRCIVVDADSFDDHRSLYVALTRASTELVVMANKSTLGPL